MILRDQLAEISGPSFQGADRKWIQSAPMGEAAINSPYARAASRRLGGRGVEGERPLRFERLTRRRLVGSASPERPDQRAAYIAASTLRDRSASSVMKPSES